MGMNLVGMEITLIWSSLGQCLKSRAGPTWSKNFSGPGRLGPKIPPGRAGPTWAENSPGPGRADLGRKFLRAGPSRSESARPGDFKH